MNEPHLSFGIAGKTLGPHQDSCKRQPGGHQQTRVQEDVALIGKIRVNAHGNECKNIYGHVEFAIFFKKHHDILGPRAILIGDQSGRIIYISKHEQQ